MSDVNTNNDVTLECGKSCPDEVSSQNESPKLPNVNDYDKLFSQLLNMNLLNQFKKEIQNEEVEENDGGDGDDGDDGDDDDEGSEGDDSDYSDDGFTLNNTWETLSKLVESHLNITNSIATLLKKS
jgi:hypothetical protein